jgi:hypothetical protein
LADELLNFILNRAVARGALKGKLKQCNSHKNNKPFLVIVMDLLERAEKEAETLEEQAQRCALEKLQQQEAYETRTSAENLHKQKILRDLGPTTPELDPDDKLHILNPRNPVAMENAWRDTKDSRRMLCISAFASACFGLATVARAVRGEWGLATGSLCTSAFYGYLSRHHLNEIKRELHSQNISLDRMRPVHNNQPLKPNVRPVQPVEQARPSATSSCDDEGYVVGGFVPEKGIFLGKFEPYRNGEPLDKAFYIFVAPQDLYDSAPSRLLRTFEQTAKEVGALRDWNGHNGAAYKENELLDAVENDTYRGQWVIPPASVLTGFESGHFSDSMFKHRHTGEFKGSYVTQPDDQRMDWYWSSTEAKVASSALNHWIENNPRLAEKLRVKAPKREIFARRFTTNEGAWLKPNDACLRVRLVRFEPAPS